MNLVKLLIKSFAGTGHLWMMFGQMRYVNLSRCEFAARYMCTSIERVAATPAKDVQDQKSAYYKQMAANQSEYNEKPAGWENAKPYSKLPGPKPAPIFGNLWRFFPGIGTYYGLDQISQHRRFTKEFGNIVKLSGLKLRPDIVLCFEPEDIEKVYRNEGVWPHREGLESLIYYKLNIRNDIFKGEGGVLTGHGEKWFYARSVVNPPMMQPRSAQQYIGVIDDTTHDFIRRLDYLQSKHPQGEMPADFDNEISKWALESICVIGLNKRLGLLNSNIAPDSEEQVFINDVLDLFKLLNKLDVEPSLWKWISTPTFRRYVKTLNRIMDFERKHMDEAIAQFENSKGAEKSQSELSVLEQLLKRDKKVAYAMVFDMFVAGIDTTSRTSAAALYYLSTNSRAQEKLRAETKRVLPNKDSPVTKEVLNNMPYLRACIKETTRLAPIAIGNLRRTPRDLVLSGYQIPKGTDVLNGHMYLSRQDKYFPSADEYIPDRWMKGQNEKYTSKDAHPFTFMPFGFGPRSCIGKRFAQLEMEILLAKLIRNYTLSWPHDEMKWYRSACSNTMLVKMRLVNFTRSQLTTRYMSTATEAVVTNKNQKSAYYKHIAKNQSESNEKPAGWDTAKPFSEVPGPKPIPILGNLWRFFPGIGAYGDLDMLSQQHRLFEEYGPIVKITKMKMRPDMLFLSDPKDIEMMFRNDGVWPQRDGMDSIVHYRLKIRNDIFQGQGGVLTSQGEQWFDTRSVVNQPLMKPRSAQQYVGVVDTVTQDLISRIDYLISKHPQGEMPKDFLNELAKWALESICAIGLDKRLGLLDSNLSPDSQEQTFINDVLEFFILMNELDVKVSLWKFYSTPTWKRYVKILDRIVDFQKKNMDEAIEQLKKQDGVERKQAEMSILEQLLKKDKKIALAMIFDMLLAGIDTTSRTVAAALYFLAKNQQAQERLRAEVRSVLPNKDSPVTKDALNNMPYLKAVIKETTRMAPIGTGNMRQMTKDIVLSGYQIPKGTEVISMNLILSFQDKYFVRAKEFIPERWMRGEKEEWTSKDANPFVSLPFGFGPRSCVGRRLAQLELDVLIAKIARNYTWTWPHEDMKWSIKLLYGVDSPLKYHMKPQSD
ncbi:Cytochrome P450 301a1 [Carabus blaptoides fortunei]